MRLQICNLRSRGKNNIRFNFTGGNNAVITWAGHVDDKDATDK